MNFSDLDNTYAKIAFHSLVVVTFIAAQLVFAKRLHYGAMVLVCDNGFSGEYM